MLNSGVHYKWKLEDFPSNLEIISQVLVWILIDDAAFYFGHRLLHDKKFYPLIHKIHHEYTNTISLCAIYCHPIEYIVADLLPVSIGFIIYGERTHLATFMIW